MNLLLLKNSLLVGVSTTLLASIFGLMAALWLMSLERPWKNGFLAAAICALVLPPFLVTNCWLHYLGYSGVWRGWLHFEITSIPGTIWILSLLTWPIPMLGLFGAWKRLDPTQLESDPAVTGLALFRALLWPLGRVALGQAAVLTFILSLNNFAVPAILQVKVFTAEVWVQFTTNFDTLAALQLAWPLIVAPVLVLLLVRQDRFALPKLKTISTARLFRRQLGQSWFWVCGTGTVLLIGLSAGLPIFQLVSMRRTWTELPGALAAGQLALWNSAWFAAAGALLVVCAGLAGAALSESSYAPSWIPENARGWIRRASPVLWLPLLLPGVLLGLALIQIFNRAWLWHFYQSSGIVVLAFAIRYLGLGWHLAGQALGTVDANLTDAARLAGASRWQMLRHIHWPQIASQLTAGWYLVFLLCLWDVETMILIMPPGGETLALRVFNLLHYGHNAQVNALCLTLVGVALIPLALWGGAQFFTRTLENLRASQSLQRLAMALVFLLLSLPLLSGCGPASTPGGGRIESVLFSRVRVIGTRGAGVGELNKPRSVAVDRLDNLYVVDMTGRVQKFSPEGVFQLFWQMPQTDKGKPKGMCRDEDGNIVVIEPHYQRVNYFSTGGKLLEQWGRRGTNVGELIMPRAAAVNSKGEMFVSEYSEVERVQEFKRQTNASGEHIEPRLLACFGQMGDAPGQFNRPEGLCVDNQDRLYVADSCNHRIQIFSSDGKFIRSHGKAGSGKGQLSYPYDICVDHEGRQYVCEFGNSRIQIFDAADQPIEIIGGPGGEPGRFSNPWGVALDSAGNLYVADSQNHRVQKFIRKKPGTS